MHKFSFSKTKFYDSLKTQKLQLIIMLCDLSYIEVTYKKLN